MNNIKEYRGRFEGNFEEPVNMVVFFFVVFAAEMRLSVCIGFMWHVFGSGVLQR